MEIRGFGSILWLSFMLRDFVKFLPTVETVGYSIETVGYFWLKYIFCGLKVLESMESQMESQKAS